MDHDQWCFNQQSAISNQQQPQTGAVVEVSWHIHFLQRVFINSDLLMSIDRCSHNYMSIIVLCLSSLLFCLFTVFDVAFGPRYMYRLPGGAAPWSPRVWGPKPPRTTSCWRLGDFNNLESHWHNSLLREWLAWVHEHRRGVMLMTGRAEPGCQD